MNKKYLVSLTEAERASLKEKIRTRSPKSSVVLNAQILLAADTQAANLADVAIAQTYHVSPVTIQRVREKFVLHGIEIALNGLPRGPQAKTSKIDGDVEAQLVRLACSATPDGYQRWTLRLLADKVVQLNYLESISHEAVRQVLKKTKLSLGNSKCG
jgi:transposase